MKAALGCQHLCEMDINLTHLTLNFYLNVTIFDFSLSSSSISNNIVAIISLNEGYEFECYVTLYSYYVCGNHYCDSRLTYTYIMILALRKQVCDNHIMSLQLTFML